MVLAIVGLSSCAGYTSAAKTTPGNPGAGVLSASATSVSFGSVAVGNNAAQSLTVTNTGTATVTISQATMSGAGFSVIGGNPSGTIPVGQTSTIQVQFAPTTAGAITGSLTVISDASNSPLMISLSGTGTQNGLAVAPSALTFGNVVVGQTGTQSVELTNTGTTNVVINLATVTGNGFGISGLSLPKTLTGGQSLSFNVQFAPSAAGAATGSITFTDNAPTSPQTVILVGSGVSTSSALTANPGSVSFGNISMGSNGQQTITLTNSGNTSATISTVAASGGAFTAVGISTPLTLAASQSTSFVAQFAPTTAGTASGSITITSNANDPTISIPLTGTGVQGNLTANPSSINFGSLLVGASGSVNVTLTNSGTASVTISQGSASGIGFSMTGLSVPATLTAGQTTTFTAKFSPTAAGAATGNISIASNAPGSPLAIALTGSGTTGQPQLTMSPASVSYGNVSVGGSATQTITLTNSGNATLTVSQASASGTGFSVSGASWPMTINAGSSASFAAVFAPTSSGAATGSISVVSNAPGSPALIALSGTGVQGQLGASPSSVSFGSVNVGSSGSQTVTLTNSGTASLTISQASAAGTGFSVSGITTPLTLGAGQSTSFTAKFSPTSAGSVSGSVSIVNNGPNSPITVALNGSGTATAPQLSISPASVSYGNVAVGSSVPQTITLTNSGNGTLTVTQASASGTGFSVGGASLPMTIGAGSSGSFSAVFAPTSAGAATGSVSIISDAPGSPAAIALSGTGVQGQLGASPSSVNFGSVNVGSSGSQTVTLTNSGSASLTIAQATASGAGFSVSGISTPLTLGAGQSTSFVAKFSPTSAGSVSGSVSLSNNGPNSPVTVALTGSGNATAPQLTISPASVSYGSVAVGSSAPQTITLTNSGNAPLTVAQATASGAGFSVSGASWPMTINAGSNASFTATFAPTTAGAATGSISVVSNAPGSPAAIGLSGTGVQGQLGASPSSVSFGSITVGSSGSQAVTLTNSGTASLTISQAIASGTGFSVSGISTPLTLGAGQSTSFTAKFSPTSAGTVSGSVSLTNNGPNSPVTVALTGSGTATAPQLTITPASVNYGNVAVGSSAPQTITLTNSGNATLTVTQAIASGTGFSMSGATMPTTINAGSSASFTATFAPTSAGAATGSISVVSNAPGSPAAIALSGTGTQGQLGANPASVNFGSVAVGSNGSQTITLTNSGSANVTISQATASGTGFSISGLAVPQTLGAGLSTTLTAQFAPTSAGSPVGSISIISNAPSSPLTISLSGTATQPQLTATPTSAAFGNVVTGTSNSQTINLTNGGTATVTISAVTVAGAGFSTTGISAPVSIAAGKSATFNAVFAPTAAGAVSGSVSLTNNAPNSPLTIVLSGTGLAATKLLGLSTSSLSFGNVNVGSNSALTAALTNNGNANVTISSVGATGTGFSASGVTSGEVLAPNQSVTVTVTFAPGTAGAVSGSVSIVSDATNSPATINVSGTGVSATPPSVVLTWAASTSTVSGYNVYRGTTSNGPYSTKLNTSLVTTEQYKDSTVVSGQTYYYVVTAVDSNNVESVDSNQATAIIP